MIPNKTAKAGGEQSQILENILALANQLKQIESAEVPGEPESPETHEQEVNILDEILSGVQGLTTEQVKAIKEAMTEKGCGVSKTDDEKKPEETAEKSNAEEETGKKPGKDEQPGAKAKKADDNTGAGSNGSGKADDRLEEDQTKITQDAVSEVAKAMVTMTSVLKTFQTRQDSTEKALEGVMETLGFDRAMKSAQSAPESKPHAEGGENVMKSLLNEISALNGRGERPYVPVGGNDREGIRKSLRDNLASLLGR